jgi:hypothetical protein
MAVRVTLSCLALVAAAAMLNADEKHQAASSSNAGFEKFKQLAGDWEGKEIGEDGHAVKVRYKVTSGGSAVAETIDPNGDHEMITMIHPDGGELLLTHYCMLGNQPQMKAAVKGDASKIEFKFLRATNLKSDKEMHMHDVTYSFVDKDTLKTEWTNYDDGKPAKKVVFELKRKK